MGDTASSRLSLTESQIGQLAAGFGGPEEIHVLREGQHSKFLQSLASIIEIAPGAAVDAAIALIDRAQAQDEQACWEVLTYPYIGEWAWACLEQLMGLSGEGEPAEHLGHLSAIAVVAAFSCGVKDFELEVPVRGGGVVLPGLGRAVMGRDDLSGLAVARCRKGQLWVCLDDHEVHVPDSPGSDSLDWQAVRRVYAESRGLEISLAIDDIDPYRHSYLSATISPPADRLDEVGFKTWKEELLDTWDLLVEHHREYAVGIAAGLRVLVPMADDMHSRHDRSPQAFGAIVVTSVSKRWTAYAMLEEFQRTKLSALNYLFPLHNATYDENAYCLIWNEEPCPFRWAIEYLYALPAIVEYWDVQSRISALRDDRITASTLALRWWSRADDLREQVVGSGELTRFGHELLDGAPPLKPPVAAAEPSPEITALARLNEVDNRICWRLHNLAPAQAAVDRLASAWISAKPCPMTSEFELCVQTGDALDGWRQRRWAALLKLTDPERFAELKVDASYLRALNPSARPADVLLADGLREEAMALYSARVLECADDLEAWAGLAIACHGSSDLAAVALERFPESVCSVHRTVVRRYGDHPDPVALATWLAPLLLCRDDRRFTPATSPNSG